MISVYIDTNVINSKQNDLFVNQIEELTKKYPDHLIIEKTDTLDTELLIDKFYNFERLKKSESYIESYGIAVLGHSRLGHSIVGSDEDDKTFSEILEILFGKKARKDYSRREIRDGMHLMTAIRYGGTYFITHDSKILSSSDKIKNRFSSILICTPKECLEKIRRRLDILLNS